MRERSRHISNIILLLSGYTLIRLVTADGLISTIISRFFNSIDDVVFYSLTFILPLPALALLWYQKKSGYIGVLICCVYSLIKSLMVFYNVISAPGNASVTDTIFLLVPCGIYGELVYILFRKNVISESDANRKAAYCASAAALIISLTM